MDKKLRLETVETVTKCSAFGSYKRFYKNGVTRQIVEMKDGEFFGFYREFYKNGKIKYETEYVNSDSIKGNSYYTWTKKGVKYLHQFVDIDKTTHVGNLIIISGYSKCKKIKVKNATYQ